MWFGVVVSLCLFNTVLAVERSHDGNSRRESRKLFGGYRITPRFCKPTRQPTNPTGGPNICMFNHECLQRNGEVVGACMDGFLFGACCQLPAGVEVGEFLTSELLAVSPMENTLSTRPFVSPSIATKRPPTTPMIDITSSGVSQIAASLLSPSVLPTAQDNVIVQIGSDQSYFSTTGVTHPQNVETIVLNQQDNEIDPGYFMPTTRPAMDDRKTTMRIEETTIPYSSSPILHISVSNAPLDYTPSPAIHRPMFRPKPTKPSKPSDIDKYVLVPTIMHDTPKPNKTQEYDSIVNIIHLLNSTTKKPPSTSYVFSTSVTKRPGSDIKKPTSPKPPSTSYVYSTTVPPRRTELPTTTKKKTTTKRTKPTKPTTSRPVTIITKRPSGAIASHVTPSKTTVANSPAAFLTSQRPPSTSYIYNSVPTRRPPSTVNTHIAGPGFTVTSAPLSSTLAQFSNYPSPAPTVIVLGPVTDNEIIPDRPSVVPSTYEQHPVTIHRPTAIPQRKPINQVTINNHVTQNIYSTSESPSPTVLITPKPSISTSVRPQETSDTVEIAAAPSQDELINFPPVRNPNLNMSSLAALTEDDITTPAFIEDEALNANIESFVNKVIQGLQEPFGGLKDIVYNKNNSTVLLTNSGGTTTKKPIRKQGTTTKKPPRAPTTKPSRPVTSSNVRPATSTRPPSRPITTRRTTTRKPTTTVPTRRQTSTTKRTRATTKKPVTTTTESLIDHQTEDNTPIDSEDYRTQCGVRPLVKTGRIVGGKGATFGEFPWQVLVRESTWLGLFTKNKCGGVLISHKYVMTAAHCQPGFLASLVAVFGEFDISGDLESKRSISRNVKRVIVHRQYDAATFENDLALLELEQPVQFDSHIIPICLPRDGDDFTGRMATVTGWGRLKYGGGVPSVLQEVQVPIMENPVCQEMFRTAGHSKVIMDSFLCAGYANGQKDSCEGDSGGPLVLQRPDGRYQLAGTVSHGIKCAAPYLPGVYMRTQYFKPWITSITGVTSP